MANAQEQQPRITINRRRGQSQFYEESLPGKVALQMMRIPRGAFFMGSPEDELERSDNEGPQHAVSIESFDMGKYPVTQAQWQAIAGLSEVNRELKSAPSHFKGDKRPVERVSWYDAVEFCERLSVYTGRFYRLPTEAEWEYACRALPLFIKGISKPGDRISANPTTVPFHFGETITTDLANYRGTDWEELGVSGSYGRGPKGEFREETTPVDHFGVANEFGLCDMHGNVWEWCEDHWHKNYKSAPANGSAWIEGGDESRRVLRGGSWLNAPRYCRSAYRYSNPPDNAYDFIGFRVVCGAPRGL